MKNRGFPWKCVWYGDSRENLLEMLTVAIMSSPISSVCGVAVFCMYVTWQLYCLSDFWEFLPCTDKISPPNPFFVASLLAFWFLRIPYRGLRASALLLYLNQSQLSTVILCRKFVGSLTFENFLPRRSGWCRSVVLSMLWWALRYVLCVTWLVFICDMTHSHVWNDSFVCVTWLIVRVEWLIRIFDMTRLHVWHDSCICVEWLIRVFDMTHVHAHVWHDSSICVSWLIRMYDVTH